MDFHTIAHVIYGNEYNLPDTFKDEDVIVDVGANIGSFAVMCLCRGAGRLVCCEPDADNVSLLRVNTSLWKNQVEIHRRAVWGKNVRTIGLTDGGWHTSQHRVIVDGMPMAREQMEMGRSVPCVSLDVLLEKEKDVRLLKLDCEGAEWSILNESKSLKKCREMVVEVHSTLPMPGYVCTKQALLEAVDRAGFNAEIYDTPDRNGINYMLRARRRGR